MIGTVLGSNILNIVLCLGIAGLSGAIRYEPSALAVDLAVLVGMTVLAASFIRGERTISRAEGGVAFLV